MENELLNLRNSAVSLILEAKSKDELEEIKLAFLGRSGSLTQILKRLPQVPTDERPRIGRVANEVKNIIEDTISQQLSQFISARTQAIKHSIDVTDPGELPPRGHLHPVTQAIEEITTIFQRIGFYRVRYPEIEWDWYAFEALNFPENHPARDDWETFFIDTTPSKKFGQMLLTPHTSSGQIREMERVLSSEYKKQHKNGKDTIEM